MQEPTASNEEDRVRSGHPFICQESADRLGGPPFVVVEDAAQPFSALDSRIHADHAWLDVVMGGRTRRFRAVRDDPIRRFRADGFFVLEGSISSSSTAAENGLVGIGAGPFSTVSGNTAHRNGSDGIECGVGCVVRGNSVRENSGFRLNLGSQSGFREKVVSSNATETVTGSGVDAGANVINGVVTPTP